MTVQQNFGLGKMNSNWTLSTQRKSILSVQRHHPMAPGPLQETITVSLTKCSGGNQEEEADWGKDYGQLDRSTLPAFGALPRFSELTICSMG